jgi:hypothetical protein
VIDLIHVHDRKLDIPYSGLMDRNHLGLRWETCVIMLNSRKLKPIKCGLVYVKRMLSRPLYPYAEADFTMLPAVVQDHQQKLRSSNPKMSNKRTNNITYRSHTVTVHLCLGYDFHPKFVKT